MPDFRLQSKYVPTGDQPTAIEELTTGLTRGDHEQTLLGVTGSGKSVVYESEVFIRRFGKITHIPIGEIVDSLFENFARRIEYSGDSEFINMANLPRSEQFETQAFSSLTGATAWKRVTQISRHSSGKTLKVTTACGRQIASTADHNFFIARKGKITLTDGGELGTGDWLPVPRYLPEPLEPLSQVDLCDYLSDDFPGYVALAESNRIGGSLFREVIGYQKQWRVAERGERLQLAEYRRLNAAMPAPMEAVTIGTIRLAGQLPSKIELSKSVLRFLGYYVAEGHATERYVVISTGDSEVASHIDQACAELGLRLHKRNFNKYGYQISSTTLAHLLTKLCGSHSARKKLPTFWPQLSNTQLGTLLSAYFSGDGGVDGPQITAATVSDKLASDLQYALLRFGIHGRRRAKRTVRAVDGKVFNSWVISISGSDQLRAFRDNIGFSLDRKMLALEGKCQKVSNTNVDLVPINGVTLKQIRTELGLFQRELADSVGVEKSYVSMLESGHRLPSRTCAERIVQALSHFAVKQKNHSVLAQLNQMRALTRLFWSPIVSISESMEQTRVYDLAVSDFETFLTGKGGVYVHNTFTMANIVQKLQRPTLVLSHNKTLAAQLYGEFRQFFPDNAVQYFVSYYDYYQPEAYIPRSDTFIEKDSSINEEIDRLRHAATMSLLTRRDVLIVASVSCIYGLGNVSDYTAMTVDIKVGQTRLRDKLLRQLSDIQYARNDIDFSRGRYRVRGDTVDIFPIGEETAYRLEFFGDELERIRQVDPLTGEVTAELKELKVFPAKHYVTPQEKLAGAVQKIGEELDGRLLQLEASGKNLEAQRLKQRTKFDMEMLQETGFVPGIENYSRFLSNRQPGEQPATLLDYFPDDFLMFVDESHITLPQVRGMFNGDRARKETLVDYGFRLPSALDNRPLKYPEFERHINQVVYVSATPGDYEISKSSQVVRQVIRPTGLLDPQVEVRPVDKQIDDLIAEIKLTVKKGQRVLVTTLTKRMAEDLSEYLKELSIKVQYLHSEVQTLDRIDILQDLRAGVYDVLVGINLLREGLDLPEVSLVAILDADKEGFLRGKTALVQTIGRAARHVEGRVIMYADHVTDSMKVALDTTNERRAIQEQYNQEHGITPEGIKKAMGERMQAQTDAETSDVKPVRAEDIPKDERIRLIDDLTKQMELAASNLQFEKAALLRDQVEELKAVSKSPRRTVRGR